MEYSGQLTKYPVNRPLTEEEKANRLNPKKKRDVSPHYNMSVIRINSTYLEVVDKFYAWKGMLTLFSLTVIAAFGGLYLFFFVDAGIVHPTNDHLIFLGGISAMWVPMIGFMIWNLLREMATYTHYPIRLNRQNRMVYVFRRDGTVLEAAWDALFIAVTPGSYDYAARSMQWNLRAHVLDQDGETVKETFAFPMYDTLKEELLSYWEFVRRYMEEGPAKLIGSGDGQVETCHPIGDRKEGFKWGMLVIYSQFAPVPLLFWLMSPLLTLIGLARYLANLTCEVPVWPRSVEEACPLAPGDAYARDYRDNPESLRKLVPD